jgi:hypothetical protein
MHCACITLSFAHNPLDISVFDTSRKIPTGRPGEIGHLMRGLFAFPFATRKTEIIVERAQQEIFNNE